jgi:hypothetical protein
MKGIEKIGAFFWLVLSSLIMEEASRLPFGTLSQPKSGLYPFILGVVLGLLSLGLLITSFFRKGQEKDSKFSSDRQGLKKVGLVLGVMVVFFLGFERVGFLLSAFFVVFVLIKFVEPQKWSYSALVACLISLCAYVLLEVFLRFYFPKGILENLGF